MPWCIQLMDALAPSPLEKAVLELRGQLCWDIFTVVDGKCWVLIWL